jgi:hypothetical protein
LAQPNVISVPSDDAWAHAPEVQSQLRRAAAASGRSYRVGEAFLQKLIDEAERAGGSLDREQLAAMIEEAVRSGEVERVEPAAGSDDGTTSGA